MTFPVYLDLGFAQFHPHLVFELLAYAVGFRLFGRRQAQAADFLPDRQRWWLAAAAIFGALAGSRIVFWLTDPALMWIHRADPAFLFGGKTIVGGLAGGLLAVEWAKARLGIVVRTGDRFALPLAAGIAIGRIGCFLTGPSDHTAGLPTNLPLGFDFGDGVARFPTQLYEVGFLALVCAWLWAAERRAHAPGALFRTFLAVYMGFRLLVDFLKPGVPLLGLTGIQWVCLAVLVYCVAWRSAPAEARAADSDAVSAADNPLAG